MLKQLRELFNKTLINPDQEDAQGREHALRLATATLLIEIVRADYEEDIRETEAVIRQLQAHFNLTEDETLLLIKEAEQKADHSVSLQDFTRVLHERLSEAEKHTVIEMLWRIALADDHLDKHEDHVVRKVAGLLYVTHSDLIRIRNAVKATQTD
ncbi:MAG: TerB family tellurite resistance protein [Gammaproteobacteria bacterium]|nr:TerB family tellurite resistance protein [Gammaproteobacteria bacterium]MCZ6585281.1 TerB family tellurite resistance protein [Gammaproteobacteria bacterium]